MHFCISLIDQGKGLLASAQKFMELLHLLTSKAKNHICSILIWHNVCHAITGNHNCCVSFREQQMTHIWAIAYKGWAVSLFEVCISKCSAWELSDLHSLKSRHVSILKVQMGNHSNSYISVRWLKRQLPHVCPIFISEKFIWSQISSKGCLGKGWREASVCWPWHCQHCPCLRTIHPVERLIDLYEKWQVQLR